MKAIFLMTILGFTTTAICAQKIDSAMDRLVNFPNKFFSKMESKTASLDEMLTKKTEKYLERLAKKERKLEAKLRAKDSVKAKEAFAGAQEKYNYFEKKIKELNSTDAKLSGEYLPYIDSMKSSLSFLQKNQQIMNMGPQLQGQLGASIAHFNQLQSKLQVSQEIQQFMQQRKQLLHNLFNQSMNSLGVRKMLSDYNKQAYYYEAQVKEYEETLNDPDKMAKKALVLLDKLPAFQDFMKKNSVLASLLNIPSASNGISPNAVGQGLPSRDQVMSMIQGQVGMAAPNPAGMVQNSVQGAEGQLDQLRDQLKSGGGNDLNMPNFKPNSQKTRSFLKRLELGTNLQTTHSTYYFPTTTDIALSLGYKLSDKGVMGIGASYKIGWGSDINHIKVTSEGVGLRSFLDVKLKKNIYISGGYEENYQQPFSNFQQISSLAAWQSSGLLGLTKMVSFSGKLVKKTKLQVLWDFLSYYQVPRTQPFKFRVGYNF